MKPSGTGGLLVGVVCDSADDSMLRQGCLKIGNQPGNLIWRDLNGTDLGLTTSCTHLIHI